MKNRKTKIQIFAAAIICIFCLAGIIIYAMTMIHMKDKDKDKDETEPVSETVLQMETKDIAVTESEIIKESESESERAASLSESNITEQNTESSDLANSVDEEAETAESILTKISREEAIRIALKEAEKDCYDYQGWESDYSPCTEELVTEEQNISAWEWIIKDKNGVDKYQGQTVWSVRLQDENDPLTSLIVLVDAEKGEVVGAYALSD